MLAFPKPDTKKDKNKKKSERKKRRSAFHTRVINKDKKCMGVFCMSAQQFDKEALHAHHIIHRSQGGKDTVNNGIALCPLCHDKVHKGGPNPYDTNRHLSGKSHMILILAKYMFHPNWRWTDALYHHLITLKEEI